MEKRGCKKPSAAEVISFPISDWERNRLDETEVQGLGIPNETLGTKWYIPEGESESILQFATSHCIAFSKIKPYFLSIDSSRRGFCELLNYRSLNRIDHL